MNFDTISNSKWKEKNRITPDVILLKIDHCANIATPTTVVTDEMAIIISLGWTPNNMSD
jgi:hypothetical protein